MTVLAIAHRAGNDLTTLPEVVELGVDVVECDVHLHRGSLEVRHLKTAGPLPFLWDKWQIVPASAPRLKLAQLLAAELGGATLMLDLKGPRISTAAAVAAQLCAGPIAHPVWVCGRHWPLIDVFTSFPQVGRVLSARNSRELARLRRRLSAGAGEMGVSVHQSLLTREVVADLHRHVDVVMTWPVNDEPTLERMLGLGVSGIISDEAQVLAELVRRR